jgi:pimeloyl-ACP methyl ester carboxylesterase
LEAALHLGVVAVHHRARRLKPAPPGKVGPNKKPAEEATWVAAHVHGTVLMVDGAGHYPHAELPEQVGARIVAFLADGDAA